MLHTHLIPVCHSVNSFNLPDFIFVIHSSQAHVVFLQAWPKCRSQWMPLRRMMATPVARSHWTLTLSMTQYRSWWEMQKQLSLSRTSQVEQNQCGDTGRHCICVDLCVCVCARVQFFHCLTFTTWDEAMMREDIRDTSISPVKVQLRSLTRVRRMKFLFYFTLF